MIESLKPGIKRSVLIIAVLPVTVVTLLLTLIFVSSQIRNGEQSLSDRGFALARQLAPASEYGVYSRNLDVLQPLIDSIMAEQDVVSVEIRMLDGRVLIRDGKDIDAVYDRDNLSQEPSKLFTDNQRSWVFHSPIYQTEFSDSLFDEPLGIPETNNSQRFDLILGDIFIELSLDRIRADQIKISLGAGFISFAVLLISAVLALRLGRSITEPVLALKAAVGSIESGNFDQASDSGAQGELLSLESGINSMARALKRSRDNLEERVKESTSELRKTLSVLEQRNAELDTARSQAESANKAKSEFLAKISHEFRTPLNGIYGFLQLLKKSSLNENQQSHIQKISSSTKALLALINEILDFSKVEASEIRLKKTTFNLHSLILDCADTSFPEAQEKGLKINIVVDKDLPQELIGDANRIAQVIRNLVNNAVKFTERGSIRIHAFKADKNTSSQTLSISVTDTGIGISSNDKQALFHPFTQLEPAMTKRHGGAGLGLAISKSLIELMEGTISAGCGAEGRGSCFTVTFPFETPSADSLGIPEETSHRAIDIQTIVSGDYNNLRVLVADDNTINRQFLSIWLHQLGAIVDEAFDGQEAVRKCAENHYDIIFMDLHMPILDGLEAAELIKKNALSSKQPPIVAVTADVTENTKKQIFESALDDCLLKPVSEDELVKKIEKWCFQTDTNSTSGDHKAALVSERCFDPIDKSRGILLASGNEGLWRQSLKTLVMQLDHQKIELAEAVASNEPNKLSRIAHKISGAASYCGAMELASACNKLRKAANLSEPNDIETRVISLNIAISRTQKWVDELTD